MKAAAQFRSWLRSILQRSRLEEEMEAELRFHIQSYQEDLMRQGMSREEAFRRARLEFGGIEARKEDCRASLGLRLWDEFRGDIRYALRTLRHNPGFTAIAVGSLALGIGANTAIFSLAKEVLLTTMAVPDACRLRLLEWAQSPHMQMVGAWGSFKPNAAGQMTGTPFPYPLFREMQRHNTVFDGLVGFKDVYHLTANVAGQAESIDAMLVSGNFYQDLRPKIIAGRAITPGDDAAGAPAVAVISDAYWARRFGRSAAALGQTIDVNSVPVTIVGVNAPEFKGPKAGSTPEVFLPISLQPQVVPSLNGSLLTNHSFWWTLVLGRLKPGVSDEAAQAAAGVMFAGAFHATQPGKRDSGMPRLFLAPGSRGLDLQSDNFTKPLLLLLALSGLVLAIACANLANLLLARSAARQREMSVRLAMGAGRWRIMRQVFAEAALLALFGGAAGLLLGYSGRNLIPALFENSWRSTPVTPPFDWLVFLFAFGITVLTGVLFGAAPAWRATRADVNTGLKDTGRMTISRPHVLLGKSLVVFQVSLSVLLLVGAGLFLRTLLNLKSTAIGFNPEHILLFDLDAPRTRYSALKRVALYQQLEDKVAQLPGVQSATLSSDALVANESDEGCFRPTGRPPRSQSEDRAWTNNVGSRFFETFGIPIVAGRGFSPHDNHNAPKVAVINQRLAQEFFPHANPVGKTISTCGGPTSETFEVVGVSANTKYDDLKQASPPLIYFPYLQAEDVRAMTYELKTAANTASVVAELRPALASVDKDLPLVDVRTQTQQIEATYSGQRAYATLSTGFGVFALILANIGIYGIMAYTVSRRTNEIGIRMALGAQPREVLSMVLGETSVLALIGVVAGLGAAIALTRLVRSMLYGLKPTDPLTFAAAALLLLIIAFAAGFAPARRAASVDPMQALRHE